MGSTSGLSRGAIGGIVAGFLALLVILCSVIYWRTRGSKKANIIYMGQEPGVELPEVAGGILWKARKE